LNRGEEKGEEEEKEEQREEGDKKKRMWREGVSIPSELGANDIAFAFALLMGARFFRFMLKSIARALHLRNSLTDNKI